ncbi:hypothetical protein F4808DRAFT_340987 [Astrocystis sublimbata]|nr:hypothetical protein F4808DRAFT_340987 [Astrocystis sublimbata]
MNSTSFNISPSVLASLPTLHSPLTSWQEYIAPAVLGYVVLCRALRYRGEQRLRRRIGFPDGCGREALSRMTNEQAQQIIKHLSSYEFPEFHRLSLEFGLFRTYGVESISRLLLATRNLTDPVKSLKRYEDTGLLIGELINPPNSERVISALARINFLHSKYRQEGTISNEDLLYTLSVFVTEPPRFISQFEWRNMNEMELCAYGVFWKAIGDGMGIEYKGLLAHDTWRDGLEWADDVKVWAKRYETEKMKPSQIAHKPAVALMPMMTYWLPGFAKPFAEEVICVLMGDRLREAFIRCCKLTLSRLPEPGIVAAAIVYPILLLRRIYLGYLVLPRIFPVERHGDIDPKTGRLSMHMSYGNYPFYVKPTIWNRWGPQAWAIWLCGGKLPGDDPSKHMPQGCLWTDLGPTNRMGVGAEEMEVDIQKFKSSDRRGCPF